MAQAFVLEKADENRLKAWDCGEAVVFGGWRAVLSKGSFS
jgi:hypothetical protein